MVVVRALKDNRGLTIPISVALLIRNESDRLPAAFLSQPLLDGRTGVTVAFRQAWYYFLRTAFLREIERDVLAASRRDGKEQG